ncbi:MAG TPA: nuclease-related domain-containing protein [Thermomicrobiales bacterium]|nr:nuclease-related domain-containing protein [Thermomicrobiales bacterium]
MKIVRHDAYIAKRKRRALILAIVGFLLLIGTLFLAVNPSLILPSYLAMLFGFVVFNIGMQQVGKWSRSPRNDQVIDHRLKSLSDRYTVVHYADTGAKRIDHLLVHPGGVAVLVSREIDGSIERVKNKWRRRSGGLRRFLTFSGPQLGDPDLEMDGNIKAVEAFLESNQLEVDVDGAIVFVHPGTEFDIEDPVYPVLHGDELLQFVNSLPVDPSFGTKEREHLVSLLRGDDLPSAPSASSSRRRPVKRRAA